MNFCRCGCGIIINENKKFSLGHNPRSKKVRNDLTGMVFGKLTILKLISHNSTSVHHCKWLCKCECGNELEKTTSNIKRGKNFGCNSCYRAHRKYRPFESRFNSFNKLSTGRINVNISYDDFLEYTKIVNCHYCNGDINWHPYKSTGYHLDRKDNNLGYTKDNCVVCCPRCNRSKSDHFTYHEWLQIGQVIRSWEK
jgi:hypothetical protein